eukprot:scaffold2794_cov100-Cylindrotheca_fusiformis.AAC.10
MNEEEEEKKQQDMPFVSPETETSQSNNLNFQQVYQDASWALLQAQQLQQQKQQQQQQQQQQQLHKMQQEQNSLLMAQVLSSAAAYTAAANQQLLLQQHITHNLIPKHLQTQTFPASLNGTPGYQPALVPPQLAAAVAAVAASNPAMMMNNNNNNNAMPSVTTVQDHPSMMMIPPAIKYNGVNVQYPGLRLLHSLPPVYAVDNFLTPQECEFLISVASDSFQPAPVVGKGAGEISTSRTSSTCYLAREDVPQYMRKVQLLTGKPIDHCELPQVGRYLPTQKYLQHYDAFDLADEDGRRFASNGGQRIITVLVYLNSPQQGGATHFPNLNLSVQPKQGTALVFFPATVDGLLDKAVLHAALPAVDTKYVSQVWIRQSKYTGTASKRLPQTLGIPDYTPPTANDILQWKAAANLM